MRVCMVATLTAWFVCVAALLAALAAECGEASHTEGEVLAGVLVACVAALLVLVLVCVAR